MEIITHTNILCLPLPNGLIQLNKISTGKPDLFVTFLVCLLANSDGRNYCHNLSLSIYGWFKPLLARPEASEVDLHEKQ